MDLLYNHLRLHLLHYIIAKGTNNAEYKTMQLSTVTAEDLKFATKWSSRRDKIAAGIVVSPQGAEYYKHSTTVNTFRFLNKMSDIENFSMNTRPLVVELTIRIIESIVRKGSIHLSTYSRSFSSYSFYIAATSLLNKQLANSIIVTPAGIKHYREILAVFGSK